MLDFPVGDVAQAGLLFFAVYALFFTKEQLIEWRRKEVIKHCDIAFLEAEKIKDDVHVIISHSIGSGSETVFVWFECHGDSYLHDRPELYKIKRELEMISDHLSYMKKCNDLDVFLNIIDGVI